MQVLLQINYADEKSPTTFNYAAFNQEYDLAEAGIQHFQECNAVCVLNCYHKI